MLGGWAVASGVKGDGFHGGVGMGKKKNGTAQRDRKKIKKIKGILTRLPTDESAGV